MEEEKRENDVEKGISTARLWPQRPSLMSPSQASTQHGNLKEAPKQERQPAHRARVPRRRHTMDNPLARSHRSVVLREKRKDIEKPMFVSSLGAKCSARAPE